MRETRVVGMRCRMPRRDGMPCGLPPLRSASGGRLPYCVVHNPLRRPVECRGGPWDGETLAPADYWFVGRGVNYPSGGRGAPPRLYARLSEADCCEELVGVYALGWPGDLEPAFFWVSP